jgi:hypothetical protein
MKGEHPDERPADAVERLGLAVEDIAEEGQKNGWHDEHEHERAWVAPQLAENALGGRERDCGRHVASASARNASSRLSTPLLWRSSSGVPVKTMRPSRSSRSSSQREASSSTWLETSSVVPSSASS